jgi:hypothetical protein
MAETATPLLAMDKPPAFEPCAILRPPARRPGGGGKQTLSPQGRYQTRRRNTPPAARRQAPACYSRSRRMRAAEKKI